MYTCVNTCICTYRHCRKWPTLSQLQTTFTAVLSNAQNANYINLNVDKMLPCYSTSAAGEDVECELTGRDLHPSLVDVAVLGAAGKAAVGPCEVAMCEGDNEEETCV